MNTGQSPAITEVRRSTSFVPRPSCDPSGLCRPLIRFGKNKNMARLSETGRPESCRSGRTKQSCRQNILSCPPHLRIYFTQLRGILMTYSKMRLYLLCGYRSRTMRERFDSSGGAINSTSRHDIPLNKHNNVSLRAQPSFTNEEMRYCVAIHTAFSKGNTLNISRFFVMP